ncbi:hypothetical protein C2L65_11895 [Paraburkholderia terrae]|uniref:Uncharacterized protein n=1 Tax=Paraburkholderia terrae TaxID=311230 RepID=A0A2I8EKU9_9BURK|nr:hypothetical protein C2L65_11895 [Paraburkholderia terrae]
MAHQCPVSRPSVTHQRLLRSMDTLMNRTDLRDAPATLPRPLIDQELSIASNEASTTFLSDAL